MKKFACQCKKPYIYLATVSPEEFVSAPAPPLRASDLFVAVLPPGAHAAAAQLVRCGGHHSASGKLPSVVGTVIDYVAKCYKA
jgi:hypothetical protein